MERPNIKDKTILKYVEYLEKRLEEFNSQRTVAKSYLALKSFIESNCSILEEMKISEDNMSDKEDKKIERGQKFAKEILSHNEDLEKLEKKVSPKIIVEEQKLTGNLLEAAIFTK